MENDELTSLIGKINPDDDSVILLLKIILVTSCQLLSTLICEHYFQPSLQLSYCEKVFRPGNSTTNQLLYRLDEIHQFFDSTEYFFVRALFVDISKAFDESLN